jgi:hypothetical protein
MLSCPQCESKARWIAPIEKRQKKKSKVGIEKVIPNELKGMKFTWIAWSAIEGLGLKIDDLGFGSERRLQRITGGKSGVEQI